MEILMIVGSLRKGSFNRMLADEAMKDLKGKAEVRFLDWRRLPLLDADQTYPFSEEADIVRQTISKADALWIFCPEYNGAVPGGLKNVLDIASLSWKRNDFASGSPIKGKIVCISGAGGRAATAFAREALGKLLKRLGCTVCPDELGIALPASSFQDGKWEMSQEDKDNIAQQSRIFLQFIADSQAK